MALPALLGAGARVVGGSLVKSVAKDKAKNFITGKKKNVNPKASQQDSQDNQRTGALVIRPQTSIISPSAIIPAPIEETPSMKDGGEKSEEDILVVISKKVIEINSILKGTLAADKARSKSERQTDEKKKRKRQESALEKASPKDKKDKEKKKTNIPGSGLFSGIFNFIKNIFLGSLLINLIDKKIPGEKSILSAIGDSLDFMIDLILGTLDAFGSFLLVGKNALDGSKEWLKNNGGPEAENRFNELIGGLTNLFNAAVIVGSVFATIGSGSSSKKKQLKKAQTKKLQKRLSKGTDKKAIERYARRYGSDAARKKFGSAGQAAANRLGLGKSQIIKGGLGRTTTRLVGKTLGPSAMKAVGPVIKKIGAGFSRVPIVGSLIVAVSSLLAGEPLGQAAFKGLGSAIGGFAGSFIPIPVVGTLIGTTIGTFLGDVLYSLFLGGGPKEAGEKFKKGITDALKTMFDLGGLAVNFVKDGFERLIENFPTIDIPPRFGLQTALGKVAELFGVEDDSKFMEDGRIVKLPNLALLTPMGLPFLIPHIASSFLPDIFGESGVVNKIFGKNGTAWGGSGESIGGGTGGNQPELRGNDEGGTNIPDGDGQTSASGTSNKGMITGPAGYDRIGAGAAYHVDTKFHKSLGMGGMISAMDKLADAYAAKSREIVFSGQGYSRLKAYKSDLDPKEKKALLQSAIDAHSHSTFMRAEGFLPFDYYIPATGIRNLYHPSTEKAEILLPDFGGTTKVGALYGGYGKSANIFDSSGKHVAMTGHGDLAYAEGGETLATPHMALIGEEGKEFVIDTDSYLTIKKAYPGLLPAINKAKGDDAVEALMAYTDYKRKKGVQPKELITGTSFPGTTMADPGGHGDHIHVAYRRGVVEGLTHAMLGKDGPESVIDSDSYLSIKKAYPGLLPAINKAKGDDAVEALMAYTDYERPPEAELVMVGRGSIPSSGGSNESSSSPTGGSSSPIVMENWSEIRYKFG